MDNLELHRILSLFTDENRFRIVAAISLGANTLDKIAAMTGLNYPKIQKAITRLETSGIIQKKEDTGYNFSHDILKDLTKNISRNMTVKPKLSQLDRFIHDGHLLSFPSSRADQLLVLNHIAESFEYDHQYPEAEVNDKLKQINPDYAGLRRYLVDNGFFKRKNVDTEGGRTIIIYWRVVHQ